MALSSDQEVVASRLVIYSGCAWPVLPLLLVEGVLADFVGGSLAEAGHARIWQLKRLNKRCEYTGPPQAHAWTEAHNRDLDAEDGQSLAKALSLSSSGALRTELGLSFATARLQWWWGGF